MRRALLLLPALALSACGSPAELTIDERISDLDAAIELYATVDNASCADPGEPNEDDHTSAVKCEDGAVVAWSDEETDQDTRELTASLLSDEGIDAVVGANVTIMNIDAASVAEQIGGEHV